MYIYIYVSVCGRPSVSLNNAKRKVQNRSVEFKKKEKKNFLNLCVVGDFLKKKNGEGHSLLRRYVSSSDGP